MNPNFISWRAKAASVSKRMNAIAKKAPTPKDKQFWIGAKIRWTRTVSRVTTNRERMRTDGHERRDDCGVEGAIRRELGAP